MPQSALDYLDERVNELNREAGWAKHTRSDLIRDIVLSAIEERRAKGETMPRESPTRPAPTRR